MSIRNQLAAMSDERDALLLELMQSTINTLEQSQRADISEDENTHLRGLLGELYDINEKWAGDPYTASHDTAAAFHRFGYSRIDTPPTHKKE